MVKKIFKQCGANCNHNELCVVCKGHGLCWQCITKNNGKDKIHCSNYDNEHLNAYALNDIRFGYHR